MKKIIIGLVLSFFAAQAMYAMEFMGVKSQDKIQVSGKELLLNGTGLRKKMIFRVYVASLYLENKTNDWKTAIESEQTKMVELIFLRDVSGKTISDAIEESFKKNATDFNSLRDRLQIFKSYIPDLKKNDIVRFVFDKNSSVEIYYNGQKKGLIKGSDFCQTLLIVWLGANPADENLKKGMLGIK